jgi:hypothetical protein
MDCNYRLFHHGDANSAVLAAVVQLPPRIRWLRILLR